MKKINLKNNKGISMVDVIIAMMILTLFVGVIGSLYYQIVYYNSAIKMNAKAVSYAITIAEDTDKMAYEDVNSDWLNQIAKERYAIENGFIVEINVENYSNIDSSKEDIIKIVSIKVNYEFLNEARSYEIKKLKIKEQ